MRQRFACLKTTHRFLGDVALVAAVLEADHELERPVSCHCGVMPPLGEPPPRENRLPLRRLETHTANTTAAAVAVPEEVHLPAGRSARCVQDPREGLAVGPVAAEVHVRRQKGPRAAAGSSVHRPVRCDVQRRVHRCSGQKERARGHGRANRCSAHRTTALAEGGGGDGEVQRGPVGREQARSRGRVQRQELNQRRGSRWEQRVEGREVPRLTARDEYQARRRMQTTGRRRRRRRRRRRLDRRAVLQHNVPQRRLAHGAPPIAAAPIERRRYDHGRRSFPLPVTTSLGQRSRGAKLDAESWEGRRQQRGQEGQEVPRTARHGHVQEPRRHLRRRFVELHPLRRRRL